MKQVIVVIIIVKTTLKKTLHIKHIMYKLQFQLRYAYIIIIKMTFLITRTIDAIVMQVLYSTHIFFQEHAMLCPLPWARHPVTMGTLYPVCILRLGKDDIFGENPDDKKGGWTSVNKSNYCVRALSYCDLHKVMVSDLQDILNLYPEFAVGFLQHFQVTFNLRLVSDLVTCLIVRTKQL